MRKRSDKINNFHFPCNNELTQELGRFDALVQFQEIALLEMIESCKNSECKDNIDLFTKNIALKYGIPLTHIPFSSFESKIHQAYLIYPSGCMDRFCEQIENELKFFYSKPEVDENKNKIGFHLVDKGPHLFKIINTLAEKKLTSKYRNYI